MRLHATLLTALGVGLFGACDDGDGGDAAQPDTDRYCELARELDATYDDAFEGTEDPEAEREALEAFLDEQEDVIEELRDAAPDDVSDDVDEVWEGRASFADTGEGLDEVEAAERAVDLFDQDECGITQGGG